MTQAVLDIPASAADAPITRRPTALGAATQHRRNLLALFGSQALTWSVVLVWTFIVPRRLGPANWGLLVNGSAVGGILGTLMGLGTRNYFVREMVRAPERRSHLLAATVLARMGLCVPGAALLWLYVRWSGFDGIAAAVIWISAGTVYLTLLTEPFKAVFQAVERMEFLAASDINDKVVQSIGAIALVLVGYGVIAVAAWALIVGALVLALNVFWVRRFARVRTRTGVRSAGGVLSGSLPYWTMGLFLTFYVWIDSAMLALMTPSAVVGWYGVATRLFGTLLFVATIVSTAWLPRLVRAHQRSDGDLRATAQRPFDQLLVLSFPIAAGAAVVSAPLMRLLYGTEFDGAIPVMALLALCVIPLYVNIMANQVLVAAGRQVIWTWVMAAASVLNPLLNLALIPVFQTHFGDGAIGAALSLLVTEAAIAAFSAAFILRGVVSRPACSRGARALLATLVMTVAVAAAGQFGLAAQIGVGVSVFGVLAVLMRIPTAEERAATRRIIVRIAARLRIGVSS